MPPSDDHNRIEDLKQSLYSRNAPDVRTRRKLRFSERSSDVQNAWKEPEQRDEPVVLSASYEDHSMSFFTKLLIGSVVFCVIAVGIGAYIFLNGSNFISADNISIDMNGPVSVAAGTPVSIDITVTNKNSVALTGADLEADFPAGTTDPANPGASLTTYRQLLGDIAPGASVTETVKAVIFGEENLQKEIAATVTYGVKGSTAVFTKTQSYDVLINSSSATLAVSAYQQIVSGQPFDMTVDFKSNSASVLKGIVVKATYPFGYAFVSSSIAPQPDKATWELGDIPPGGSRSIVIHGTLSGEDSDVRAFHFSAGAAGGTASTIGTLYAETEQDIAIQKPFISATVSVNGDNASTDFVAQFGHPLQVQVKWQNNVPETLSNVVITAHLSGTAYDPTQVDANGGYFRSSTNDIVWSQQTNPELATVAAGAAGTLTFAVTPSQASATGVQAVDPQIIAAVGVSADRTQESGSPTETASVTRNIDISSDVSLTGRVVRAAGPFASSGPIPPQVDQKTTYTIVWTVDNTSSAVGNAQVTATLPPYVSWVGQTSPSSEDITYDQPSGTVIWNIGNVSTYTYGTSNRREADFQVSLLPSVDQVGQAPILINQAALTATDNFTNAALTDTQGYLTTSYSTDPSYKEGDETVVKAGGN